jgi:hypothetical protein
MDARPSAVPLLHVAPPVVRGGTRVALQFRPNMNNDTRICRTGDQSPRGRLCWTQEDLPGNLRQVGWPNIWNAYGFKARLCLTSKPLASRPVFAQRAFLCVTGMLAFRAENVGFDLAADFLYSIVIPVDLMTFQTRDIRNTSKSWQLFRLVTLSMAFAFIGLCRYRQAPFSRFGDCHVTH